MARARVRPSKSPVPAHAIVVEKVGDLTPAVLQDILQRSLANPAIHVTQVQDPEGLGIINDQYGSELTKMEVTMEEDGKPHKLHLVIKAALQSKAAWGSVIFGLFVFCRETFWFDTALPELLKVVNVEQAAALDEIVPKVHYTYCNYQGEDRQGCLLSSAIACCCCVLMTKPKEKGIILMDNLKEGSGDTYVDLKEIERTSGGGVKTVHMRMILETMAHFHGAWMVWLRKGEGMGDMTRGQMMNFFEQQSVHQWKWLRKAMMKEFMSYYTVLADAKNMQSTKERIKAFIDSPQSVDRFMKAFNYKDSKFMTMCHSDLKTSQIMFSLHEDGKSNLITYRVFFTRSLHTYFFWLTFGSADLLSVHFCFRLKQKWLGYLARLKSIPTSVRWLMDDLMNFFNRHSKASKDLGLPGSHPGPPCS